MSPLGNFAGDKKNEMYTSGKFLWPTYVNYCKRNAVKPVDFHKFSNMILETGVLWGWSLKKERRNFGMCIFGIAVKPIVTDIEYQIGGEFDVTSTDVTRNSNVKLENSEKLTPETSESTELIITHPVTDVLPTNFANSYIDNLTSNTDIRRYASHFMRSLDLGEPAVEELTNIYFKSKEAENPSDLCKETKKKLFRRSFRIIKKHGVRVYKYKSLGNSARIIPTRYGNTLNNFSSILRNYLFEKLGKELLKKGGSFRFGLSQLLYIDMHRIVSKQTTFD